MNLWRNIIAERTPFAELVLERKEPRTTQMQNSTSSLYTYYDGAPLTNVQPDSWSITNLPNTILRIPKFSVYDNIHLIHPTSPDFRFVRVMSTGNTELMQRVMPSTDFQRLPDRIVDITLNDETPRTSIFSDVTPTLPTPQANNQNENSATPQNNADDLERMRVSQLINENDPTLARITFPLVISSIDQQFDQLAVAIVQGSTTVNSTRTPNDVIRSINNFLEIDPAVTNAVLANQTTGKNVSTLMANWTKSFVNASGGTVNRMNENTDAQIAELIRASVTTYIQG